MSKTFYGNNGEQYHITDDKTVIGPNGPMGQINQFGELYTSDGSSYRVDQFGGITNTSTNTNVGNITHGKYINTFSTNSSNTTSAGTGGYIELPLSAKIILLMLLFILGTLGPFSIFVIAIAYSIITSASTQSEKFLYLSVLCISLILILSLIIIIVTKIIKKMRKR